MTDDQDMLVNVDLCRITSRSKFTVTGGNKTSATAGTNYRGIARAKNKQYRKANLNLKL